MRKSLSILILMAAMYSHLVELLPFPVKLGILCVTFIGLGQTIRIVMRRPS